MKCLSWMGVHLKANSHIGVAQLQPKVVEPAVIEHKAAAMSRVLGVHNFRDGFGLVPGTEPENLAFIASISALPEMLEGFFKHPAFQLVHRAHAPPLTVLGRSSSTSCGLISACLTVNESASSFPSLYKARVCGLGKGPKAAIALSRSCFTV